MSMPARTAGISGSATTAVETGTAQSAREKTGKSGSQTGKQNCFQCPTSMSCSHCPTNSTDWPCTGPNRYMTASSRRHGEPWTALPKTPTTWVQKPAWSPSCISDTFHFRDRLWGQQLSLHPHLHCIVPGGRLTKSGKWKTARSKGKFLFPVKAMSRVFRAKYVKALKSRIRPEKELVNTLFQNEWEVYAKRPFGHPKAVLEYLGRYT